jgi:hypothetical protein
MPTNMPYENFAFRFLAVDDFPINDVVTSNVLATPDGTLFPASDPRGYDPFL